MSYASLAAHPCNLADFTLWGGLSPYPLSMEALFEGGLKNDAMPERFEVPIEVGGKKGKAPLPVKYLKIDCHVAANANYSISIWHLFFEGYLPPSLLSPSSLLPPASTLVSLYTTHRSRTTNHLILAHLRRLGPSSQGIQAFNVLYDSLDPTTRAAFESPLCRELHEKLVREGEWEEAERILDRGKEGGLFREWTPGGGKGKTVAKWERLFLPASAAEAKHSWPTGRGGHAMVRVGRKILLFGGWDGSRDLGDLWEWDLTAPDGGWRCLESGEAAEGKDKRPGPRSCHQMVVDESEGWVYLLGGRKDEDAAVGGEDATMADDVDDRPASPRGPAGADPVPSAPALRSGLSGSMSGAAAEDRWRSDFWRYKAVGPGRGKWELISEDTRGDGGPALLFDHAMVLHSPTSRLFVFGGKNQPFEPSSPADESTNSTTHPTKTRYSGLWCYDLRRKKWSFLLGDPQPPSESTTPSPINSDRLLSRAGHALLLDPSPRHPTLYVYSGQRNEQYLEDLWAIRLASLSSAGERGRSGKRDEGGVREEDDDETWWRQGTVLDFPLLSTPRSSLSPAAAAASRSLVDLSALPASPESSPSRLGAATAESSSPYPTILQICRLWPPPPTSSLQLASASALVPPPGFTQRLVLDPHTDSWTLLTGLIRSLPPTASYGGGMAYANEMRESCLAGVWRRVRVPDQTSREGKGWRWEKIEEGRGVGRTLVEEARGVTIPEGRFAAQVVHDPLRRETYIFGGHPDVHGSVDHRLSDMWRLKIIEPSPDEALRMAKFLVRKQRFYELCQTAPTVIALQYLQNDLSDVVDHSSPSESASFRRCMAALLSAPPLMNVDVSLDASVELPSRAEKDVLAAEAYRERHRLWEEVCTFFPSEERQPEEDLEDTSRLLRVWQMTGKRC
ncbi:mei4-dependent protein 6 [Rhodotorula toruloides]|uniref:Mei4-dependent protein 6 n=1 Tax=Rhodotorula toruloides TaxID=5286 RepID=A0A511KCF7_RHOTO|nr:mei4-dependent protein 6 [Rhodotorula toruloides]